MSKLASYGPLTVPTYDDSSPSIGESTSTSGSAYLHYPRSASSSSGLSTGSVIKQPLRVRNENVLRSHATSLSSLNPIEELGIASPLTKPTSKTSRHSTCETEIISPLGRSETKLEEPSSAHIALGATLVASREPNKAENEEEDLDPQEKQRLSLVNESGETPENVDNEHHDPNPFRKWMSTLHQNNNRRKSLLPRHERWSLDDCDESGENTMSNTALADHADRAKKQGHRKSESWSSSGFVSAVKSVRMSLIAVNPQQPSPRHRRSTFFKNNSRSNRFSQFPNGDSIDGRPSSSQVIDEASLHRAIQRRNTMEEIVSSEESYVADLKVLVNVST